MIVLKWLGIIVAVGIAAQITIYLMVANMFNIGPGTERKVLRNAGNKVLLDGAQLIEVQPTTSSRAAEESSPANLAATRHLLEADGSFASRSAAFDHEVDREYLLLSAPHYSYAFKKDALFEVVNGKLSEEVTEWKDNGFSSIGYAAVINENYFLVEATKENSFNSCLYQIEAKSLKASKITENVYFTFTRPPLVFNGNSSTLVVYYTGSYDYAFGGDSSRPQKSIIRIYSSDFPSGQDLVELSFASGTVVDATNEGRDIFLVADPSRPRMHTEEKLPTRFWKISF